MNKLIFKNLNGKTILLLFGAAGLIYFIMLFVTIPGIMEYSGGMKILDMKPGGYNHAYVNSLLDNLGDKGRNVYLFNQIPLDMIFPLLFGISGCLIIAWFLKKLGKSDSILFYLSYFPLLAAFFDYMENIGIITILNLYPNNSIHFSIITNVFSVLKSSLTTVYFIILILLTSIFVWNKLFVKEQNI